ncbi:PREDICTED: sodium-coupled monocarboxylate transporter 1-like [Vollenhovia emeryi]|uniref:sodium-coupled monocarboxylate transporter 1-like n=1 Tax=Vollenhovia emeryi TaxID=411798 RepID=UPI0005F3F699|nr:PREDICTED: sodium-coupled monocarboxylate transporter 1-like [Vollenhovia emeryi]
MTSEGTLDDLDLAKRTPDIPTVQEISKSMQNFSMPDYTIFAAMLVVCGIVGIYFGFIKKSSGEDEYLVGGRNMKTFPVSLSLLASFISGITIFYIVYLLFSQSSICVSTSESLNCPRHKED